MAEGWLDKRALRSGAPGRAMRWASDAWALGGVSAVYLLTRLIGLAAFPIYFFCDEAIQSDLAQELLSGRLSIGGVFLPPYFRNVEKYNLSMSVYVHLISTGLFGSSVLITRATSALVSLLAALAVALTGKLIFRLRLWWAGALALAAMPAWFLHSRTAFETVMMVAFYACFLCCYLLYRAGSPRYLLAAIVFGAATFYSYSNGQGVMFVSTVLLLLLDARYHWRTLRANPRLAAQALALGLLVAVQYVRSRLLFADQLGEHLRSLDSYWLRPIPLSAKLAIYGQNYLRGLDPRYWFVPNGVDLDRHTIKGWGNIPLLFAPLIGLGLWECLRAWRSPAHRAVLVAVLAAPFSAALVEIHNYRVLAMVVPAALLFGLGAERLAGWLQRWAPAALVAWALALALCGVNMLLLRDALVSGPTWYSDYGLYGMQWGASQVFGAVREQLATEPGARVRISSSWANNPNAFIDFFIAREQRRQVQMVGIDEFLSRKRDLRPGDLFVLTRPEYGAALASGKLLIGPPERVIAYPDGQPGFYFVRPRYVDSIDAIFAAERQARNKPVEEQATIDGAQVLVRHSLADIGDATALFDGNRFTVLRSFEANPSVIELVFPAPRRVGGLALYTWNMPLGLRVVGTTTDGRELVFERDYGRVRDSQLIEVELPGGPADLAALRIEVRDTQPPDDVKIHVGEIMLR